MISECVSDHCNVCQKRSWIPTYTDLRWCIMSWKSTTISDLFWVLNNIHLFIKWKSQKRKENVSFCQKENKLVVVVVAVETLHKSSFLNSDFLKYYLPIIQKKIIIPWLIVYFSLKNLRSENVEDRCVICLGPKTHKIMKWFQNGMNLIL